MNNVFFCNLAIIAIFMRSVFALQKPEEFLLQYGYLRRKIGNYGVEMPTAEEIEKAILHFQIFNGHPQTGRMDERTKSKMIAPRCGVKDIHENFGEYRKVTKWQTNVITWKLNNYSETSRLSHAEQKRTIIRGLKRWSEVSPLLFQETRGKANIEISFKKGDHGDLLPFYGKGGNLGHAFYPPNGDTHFDANENWINGNQGGIDLETVAAHEFGHALGLRHSNNHKSLMAPYYLPFPGNFTLHSDDIKSVQKLYGKKPIHVTSQRTPPDRTPRTTTTHRTITDTPHRGNGFCNHTYRRIDAAMRISGNDFVFVDYNAVIDGRTGNKMDTRTLFPEGPNSVQAAVYSEQAKKAYLFEKQYVWTYSLDSSGQFNLASGSPKYIPNSHSHNPESAMRYDYDDRERIYLIKQGLLLQFFSDTESVVHGRDYATHALPLKIPNRIDATISSDNEIHFIVKKTAYRMLNKSGIVDTKGHSVKFAFRKCQSSKNTMGETITSPAARDTLRH